MHTHMYTLTMAKIMQTDRQTDKQTDRHRHTHRYTRAHTYVLMLILLNHRSRNYIHLSVSPMLYSYQRYIGLGIL